MKHYKYIQKCIKSVCFVLIQLCQNTTLATKKLKKGILKKNMAAKNAVFYHHDMVAKLKMLQVTIFRAKSINS